jgi:hypothetical protein
MIVDLAFEARRLNTIGDPLLYRIGVAGLISRYGRETVRQVLIREAAHVDRDGAGLALATTSSLRAGGVTAPVRTEESTRRVSSAEIEKQHGAVLAALDRLFEHEVPKRRSRLRMVSPAMSVLKVDRTGEGLRAFIVSRGRDLFDIGGHPELFGAVRAIVAARPERQTWNTMVLTALWANIGEYGPGWR